MNAYQARIDEYSRSLTPKTERGEGITYLGRAKIAKIFARCGVIDVRFAVSLPNGETYYDATYSIGSDAGRQDYAALCTHAGMPNLAVSDCGKLLGRHVQIGAIKPRSRSYVVACGSDENEVTKP